MTCKTCLKQYVDSTTDCFRYRWNNYKCNDRKYASGEACLLEHLFEHFNSEGHNGFLHDVSVTFINKTDAKNPIKREHYLRHTLKTHKNLMVLMLKMISNSQFTCIYTPFFLYKHNDYKHIEVEIS